MNDCLTWCFVCLSVCLLDLDGVIGSVGDQQRLFVKERSSGDSGSVGVSLLSDQLTTLQIPECNVALRTAGRHNGRTI